MVEVNRNNFEEVLPSFEKELRSCSYVSVDCEFSNLPSFNFEESYLDDGKARYSKIIKHLEGSAVLQVGLTLFSFERDSNKYRASLFNFYIAPRPPVQISLCFKPSTIQFLCRNNFNFNKCFSDGISFLNEYEEALIKCGDTYADETLNYEDKECATNADTIEHWIQNSSVGEICKIPLACNDVTLAHQEIRKRFNNIWTFNSKNKFMIIIKRITAEERLKFESNRDKPQLIESLLGFTKVFKLLIKTKKPLVGHNVFNDILIMYNQFYKKLPTNYNTFKSELHEMFPQIYDTKVMAYEIQKKLNSFWLHETSLGNLYEWLLDKKGKVYKPDVSLVNECAVKQLHDAGWDSYITGFCFIKLAYHLKKSLDSKSLAHLTFKECLHSLSFLENKVNLAKAKIPHININGKDPISHRPPALYVQMKNHLKFEETYSLFLKYGIINIQKHSNTSMLVSASNVGCYNQIIREFKYHKDISVERYSLIKHHKGIKMAICFGILLPVGWAFWYNRTTWFGSWTGFFQ